MKGAYDLEEVPQLEMELPPGLGAASDVHLVEPVAQIHPDRSQGRDHCAPEARSPEEPGWIPLAGRAIDVARVKEGTHVKCLTDPCPGLDRKGGVGLAEGLGARGSAAPGTRIESIRGDGELIVAPQRNPVLHASQGIQVLVEGASVTKNKPRLRGQSEHELHASAELTAASHAAQRRVPAPLQVHFLEVAGAAEKP